MVIFFLELLLIDLIFHVYRDLLDHQELVATRDHGETL